MNAFLEAVRADVRRVVAEDETSKWRKFSVIWTEMGLQAVIAYRFGRLLLRFAERKSLAWPMLPLGWALYGLAILVIRFGYGIRLSLTADIGPGFCVEHFGGIEVANCSLGERCSVGQQTKVGRAQDRAGPQIGDGVWIGAHAQVFGPLKIGAGTAIVPGARVTRDAPEKALLAGNPARVVFRGYSNEKILPRA
jgi:serine O-acetyltransferase